MKKAYLIPIFTLFMCLSLVAALDVSTELSSNIVVRDYDNPIILTMRINNAEEGVYNVFTYADVSIEPRGMFNLSKGDSVMNFTIIPFENLNVKGYYTFKVTLNYRGIEKIDERVTIKLVNLEEVVEVGSKSIDSKSGEVIFYVRNKEDVLLENLSVNFSSTLFETREVFNLKPKEEKTFSVVIDKDKLDKTGAGTYVLKALFDTKNGTKEILGNLYLQENKDISTTEDSEGFFIITETINKENNGNVPETVKIKITRNIFSRLFTTFNVAPITVDRNGFYIEYSWMKEDLQPTEVYEVKAKTNYLFPLAIIIFILLVIYGLKRFVKTKVELTKSVSHVRTKSGEFALRVRLSLKARKSIGNVTVIDKVPAIVKIYKKFGSSKPDKIDSQTRRIHWNLGDMDAGEQRVFSYIVYSKVGFVGKFSLPEAIVVFEKDDETHEVSSNQVFFLSDQIKGEQ